jgi:hypothetical protein
MLATVFESRGDCHPWEAVVAVRITEGRDQGRRSRRRTSRAIAYRVTWNPDTVNGIGSGDEGLAGAHDGELANAVKDNVHLSRRLA